MPGFWPPTEWEGRRRQARAAGFEARFAAAWWAIENGLTIEVAPELRELHALDPNHAPTARMTARLDRLGRALYRPRVRPLSEGPRDRDQGRPRAARDLAPPAFRRRSRRANRAARASDHRLSPAVRRAGRRTCASHAGGWCLPGLPIKRIIWLFFDRKTPTAFATTRGYFHPTWNAVVAYDARSSEPQRTARDQSWRRSAMS